MHQVHKTIATVKTFTFIISWQTTGDKTTGIPWSLMHWLSSLEWPFVSSKDQKGLKSGYTDILFPAVPILH